MKNKINICNVIVLIIISISLFNCNGCSAPVSYEDSIINEYEKYIDDLLVEYTKLFNDDYSVLTNIEILNIKGKEIIEKMNTIEFTSEQKARIDKIDDKWKNAFN